MGSGPVGCRSCDHSGRGLYNTEHLHSAIRFVTPDDRHYGREREILSRRQRVYERARRRNPSRWSGSIRNWDPIETVILNPEKKTATASV